MSADQAGRSEDRTTRISSPSPPFDPRSLRLACSGSYPQDLAIERSKLILSKRQTVSGASAALSRYPRSDDDGLLAQQAVLRPAARSAVGGRVPYRHAERHRSLSDKAGASPGAAR